MNSRIRVSIAVGALLISGLVLAPFTVSGQDYTRSFSPSTVPLLPIPTTALNSPSAGASPVSTPDFSDWVFPGRFSSGGADLDPRTRTPWLAFRDSGYGSGTPTRFAGYPTASGTAPDTAWNSAAPAWGSGPERGAAVARAGGLFQAGTPRTNLGTDGRMASANRGSGNEPFQTRRRQSVPSPAMIAVAEHAEQLLRHGAQLAARRAEYAARAEFISALEMIAQALDAETGGNYYSQCLASGLRSLREADDFAAKGTQLAADIDLAGIVAYHRTPVLKNVAFDELTPLVARQRYYTFALEQLAQAGGEIPVASQALYGLGKIHAAWSEDPSRERLLNAPKAMAAYHAALLVDPRNFLAANELGVLFAQFGQMQESRTILRHAASLYPMPETWHNLAVVHERLGEYEMARAAAGMGQQAAQVATIRHSPVPLVWVSAEQFAQLSPASPGTEAQPAARSASSPASAFRVPWSRQISTKGTNAQKSSATSSEALQLCRADDTAAPFSPTENRWPATAGAVVPVAGYQPLEQGEYVGPPRSMHVPEYRLRVDDQIDFVYRLTRDQSATPYRLNVGDVIAVEFLNDTSMDRGDVRLGQGLVVQPDGTITLHLLGQVKAAGLTVTDLRVSLTEQYRRYHNNPQIIVTPLKVNAKLEDLRAAVDSRYAEGGQTRRVQVTPEGSISLPAIGSAPAQGLSLAELKQEVDRRYAEVVEGIEVTPILRQRAPRYIFVVGEVRRPGRFVLESPTTVLQAIALAEGWNVGGNLHEVVVFRRGEDWRLIATKLDVRGALLGKTPSPADEIWLRDSDLVIVPKTSVKVANDAIELLFTRGLYGVVPVGYGVNLHSASIL